MPFGGCFYPKCPTNAVSTYMAGHSWLPVGIEPLTPPVLRKLFVNPYDYPGFYSVLRVFFQCNYLQPKCSPEQHLVQRFDHPV